jgi:cytochrome c-type biogenesis protein
MSLDVSLSAALLAGIISFLSPCVLPLVPPYLVFISGVSLDDLANRQAIIGGSADGAHARRVMLAALVFVLGFTTVFVFLGATASYVGQIMRAYLPLLAQLAGVFIILMGLHFLGLFRISLFSRDVRYQSEERPTGLLGAYGVGLAFAFGWTPCIGPVLAAILSIAASEQSVAKGMGLLAVYSLGLGIPFLLAALSVEAFMGFFKRFKAQLRHVERAMGVLLVFTGIMFLTGSMQTMAYWLLDNFPALAAIG